mgnify:CR=1 FL=1
MNHARGVSSAMSERERSVGPNNRTGVGSGVLSTGCASRSFAGAEGKCPSQESIAPWRPPLDNEIGGAAEHEGNPKSGAEVCDPVPHEHALRRHGEILAVGRDGAFERLWSCAQILMNQDRSFGVGDADVPHPCVGAFPRAVDLRSSTCVDACRSALPPP